ncbi:MAG TPA: carbohydrate ABC transporter permease [candidate division WOR-3 bacterium]|uniref:Carbohydrate ABC transporter permease n=1 Tax=candidate division WOR-3 bacterium TaxID=2052148 RepID=A0A7C5I4P9_UNCW3|nr:MAG: carbohydrate ABC transporter permease [Candidatus Hydrothermae bacterium]HHF58267.1 carbohydrate ABC transporter permease [candidate division WOR-3 bacterium]
MKEVYVKKILIVVGTIFFTLFVLAPVIWMLFVSLTKDLGFLQGGGVNLTLSNYVNIISNKNLHMLDYLKNSIIISTTVSFLVIFIAGFGAYAITRFNFPGKFTIPLMMLAISIFPQISIAGYLFKIESNLRLINTYPALIFPYTAWTAPLALWILISYFSQIPRELDEAALVDGASRKNILLKIIFPLSTPGLISAFLIVFIACINELLFALLLTTDYRAQTISVGITLFQGLHGEIPWGELMASASLVTVPLIILTLFLQKYIISGLTRGGVKG